MSPIPNPSKLDASQVLQHAFDDSTSRLRVDTEAVIIDGAIEVALSADSDSIAIGDGSNTLTVNPDGSINVNTPSDLTLENLNYYYNQISSVPSGAETAIITIPATTQNLNIVKIDATGDNIGIFILKLNGTTIMTKRSSWTNFNKVHGIRKFESKRR